MQPSQSDYLSLKETALLFGRSYSWARALKALGLKTHGGRFKRPELLAFLKKHPHPEGEIRSLKKNQR